MSLNVHVARVGIFNVDAFGARIDKNNPNTIGRKIMTKTTKHFTIN